MNIFDVLSRGKSRLHEPSISAMLGYLLNSKEDHGLSDTLLRRFLEVINAESSKRLFDDLLERPFINADIFLEDPYLLNDRRNDIDIRMTLYDKTETTEICRIVIENKIRPSAAQPEQLKSYYLAVSADEDVKMANCPIVMVFLTPDSEKSGLHEEYKNLSSEVLGNDIKIWLYWTSKMSTHKSITFLLRDILEREQKAEINPINEYLRQTIKAFVHHIDIKVRESTAGKTRRTESIGDILEEVQVTIENINYRLLRRNSGQIEIFDIEKDEKQAAKPLLRKIIAAYNLDVQLQNEASKDLNTQQLGKRVIKILSKSKSFT